MRSWIWSWVRVRSQKVHVFLAQMVGVVIRIWWKRFGFSRRVSQCRYGDGRRWGRGVHEGCAAEVNERNERRNV